MPQAVVTVVETYTDEREAHRDMHRMAKRIRQRRETGRYGVFVEKRAGVFYLCLADRGAA